MKTKGIQNHANRELKEVPNGCKTILSGTGSQKRLTTIRGVQFVNLTPHEINLNDGTVIPTSGTVARVSTGYSDFDAHGVCQVTFGEITGLPEPKDGVIYIVSGLLKSACPDRNDLVTPCTNHPETRRDDHNRIISVPGFSR